jgi:monofunctional biosynthetic peptidoglycan transglycosylase
VGVIAIASGTLFFVLIPDAKDLDSCLTTTMHEVRLCRKEPSYVPLAQISESLQNAIIVSEDSAFWDHEGIDWIELRKSFETNIEKGRFARGGSTITQQLAKNVYLSPEKSVLRKIKEAVIATRIERQFKKKLILEKYLNVVEFDKDVYGIKKAAQHYFQTTPRSLTIAQSAWLAFLLPNPPKYSISFHRNKLTPFAFKQMSEIINRLGRFKKISESDRAAALNEARSMFGGLSGESTELYDELEEEGDQSEPSNAPAQTPAPESAADSESDAAAAPSTDPIDEELGNSSNDP